MSSNLTRAVGWRHLSVFGLGLVACARGTTDPVAEPPPGPPCLIAFGEFPPSDCGFLVAAVTDSSGRPLDGRAFRADSFIPGRGFVFTSSSVLADASGRLELVVVRVDRVAPPVQPDTATVPLLLYQTLGEATALAPARARVLVQMRFAPIGQIVDTTFLTIRFPALAPGPSPAVPLTASSRPGRHSGLPQLRLVEAPPNSSWSRRAPPGIEAGVAPPARAASQLERKTLGCIQEPHPALE